MKELSFNVLKSPKAKLPASEKRVPPPYCYCSWREHWVQWLKEVFSSVRMSTILFIM